MSDIYAFPVPNDAAQNGDAGMTLRDYFAGQAMNALLVIPNAPFRGRSDMAKIAYALADDMLEARKND